MVRIHTQPPFPPFPSRPCSQDARLTPHRTLGVKTSDTDIQKKVTLDYTLAATSALTRPSDSNPPRRAPLRFVFASGILAVRDQSQSVWFGSGARHIKGDAENKLLGLTAEHGDAFDAFVVRPGGVLASPGGVAGVAARLGAPVVSVQGLAAVMVELAVGGGEEKVWENAELVARGRELLKGQVGK
jgi:hypothetical protein